MNDRFKNSWHNVHGASISEMADREAEALARYGDIIDLPHPVSKKRAPLSRESRAAQFSPFAALTGLEKMMGDTADRTTTEYTHDLQHDSSELDTP
jgi:hypothetical protein